MNEQLLLDLMNKRGFSQCARAYTNNGSVVQSITFLTEFNEDKPTYSCTVYLESREFELFYAIPCSINKLVTPKCGSVLNSEHFDRIRNKFEQQVNVLHKCFGGE